jgi:hypothetical protein
MKTIFSIFIATLLSCSILTEQVAAQSNASANDTLMIRFGDKSRMMILLSQSSDLKNLKRYDLNALVVELDSLLESTDTSSGFYISGGGGKVFLKDTTITVSGLDKDDKNVVTTQIRMGDILNLEIRHDTSRNVIEVQDLKKPKDKTTVLIETTPANTEESNNNKDDKKHSYKSRRYKSYFNIDLGLNNYLQDGNFPDAAGEPHGLRPLGSRYVAAGINQKARLGGKKSRLSFHTGLNLSWYNFMLQDNVTLVRGPEQVEVISPEAPRVLDKSKLTVAYVNIPAMLVMDFRSGKKKGLSLGLGGYGGYRIGSYTKIKYSENNRTRRDKDHNNFYLNNWRYGVTAQLGLWGINLFANYDLNNLFSDNKGPGGNDLNAFSFGIRF